MHATINSILLNYKVLLTNSEEIPEGECAAKGNGLLNQMKSFDTFFGLKLSRVIFAAVQQFYTNLQTKDITM